MIPPAGRLIRASVADVIQLKAYLDSNSNKRRNVLFAFRAVRLYDWKAEIADSWLA
jgi:hypothetical protein